MKVLGRIPGDEYVLESNEGKYALTLVSELPDAATTVLSSVQIRNDLRIDGVLYRSGTVFTLKDGKWVKVTASTQTIGTVTNMIYPMVNGVVYIRWTDPEDKDPYGWKHTKIIRKYGSYPVDHNDGVTVIDSYTRNQYQKNPLFDYLPAGTENDWYYRFFTYSFDEVCNMHPDAKFRPIEMNWANMRYIVRNGLAKNIFAVGDTITVEKTAYRQMMYPVSGERLYPKTYYIRADTNDYVEAKASDFNADGSFKSTTTYYELVTLDITGYDNKFVFEVVAFDNASVVSSESPYSVTFQSLYPLADLPCAFDTKWGEYILTADTVVKDKTKVYYVKSGDGYVSVSGLPVGKKLAVNTYYEKNENTIRSDNGGNLWQQCGLRHWLNSTDPNVTWKFGDHNIISPMLVLPTDVLDCIATSIVTTALPNNTTDRVSSVSVTTNDKLFLLSATEVHGTTKDSITYKVTKSKTPEQEYVKTTDTTRNLEKYYYLYDEGSDTYVPTTDSDFNEDGSFKSDIVYYECIYVTYYLKSGSTYIVATDEDYGPGHTFLNDQLYYERIEDIVNEGKFMSYFDDVDLTPRIRRDRDENPVHWWLRTPYDDGQVNVSVEKDDGTGCDGSVSTDPKYVFFGFVVA